METGVPNEGHFARKQGLSLLLWSFARTGFILAVCTPLAISPVPAAAQCYGATAYRGCGGEGGGGGPGGGGHGFGRGAGIGAGIVGGIGRGDPPSQ
jgi:hypothetical protein